MTTIGWVLVSVAINWPGCWLASWLYVSVLKFAGDVTFEGWIFWRGWFPVGRFRQISKKSWFGRAWQSFYGHSMLGTMIHRDEMGAWDDEDVEKTIVHELSHQAWQIALGLFFYPFYGFLSVVAVLQGGAAYEDNWNEKYARNVADRWVERGRPRLFNFGKRY